MADLQRAVPRMLVPSGDIVGEAAVWSPEEESVYWVDVCRFLIHCHHLPSAQTRSWAFDEPVVALSLSSEAGRWLVALASELRWWWPASGHSESFGYVLDGYPQVRFNDGRSDPSGRFWVGTMRNNVLSDGEVVEAGGQEGRLIRLDGNGVSQDILSGIGISNTICWSPDRTTFYTADTLANIVWAFDHDAHSGEISNQRILIGPQTPGMPDGSAMDSEGYLWNCRLGTGKLLRVAPDGRIDREVQMPVSNVTTAVFGGPAMRTLFITSATLGRSPGQRLAGSLFALECPVAGLPPDRVDVQRYRATASEEHRL